MTDISRFDRARARLLAGWRNRALGFQGDRVRARRRGQYRDRLWRISAGARGVERCSRPRFRLSIRCPTFCQCGSAATLLLIAANTISWLVAVSGSYVMNSSITFAAETGRKLRWRAYFAFVLSGVAGWLANTATLLVAAEDPAVARVARQGRRDSGKLRGELLALAFRRVPGAEAAAGRRVKQTLKAHCAALARPSARREIRASAAAGSSVA